MIKEKQIRFIDLILKTTFYLLLSAYFVYHIFSGQYGIYSYSSTSKILVKEKNALNRKKNEVEKRQNKIERLKSNHMDLDLLEEELKRNVGIVDKNEIIIFSKDVKGI